MLPSHPASTCSLLAAPVYCRTSWSQFNKVCNNRLSGGSSSRCDFLKHYNYFKVLVCRLLSVGDVTCMLFEHRAEHILRGMFRTTLSKWFLVFSKTNDVLQLSVAVPKAIKQACSTTCLLATCERSNSRPSQVSNLDSYTNISS